MVWSSVSPPDAEEKLKDIQRVADAELAGFGSRRLLTVLLERIQEIVGADTAAVLLLDRSSSELVAAETSGLEKAMRQGARVPLQQGFFAGQVATQRRPIIVDHVDETTVRNPILLGAGVRSVVGVPMLADGEVIGVLHAGSVSGRRFTVDDVRMLQLAAERAAGALQAAISRSDRQAAVALQRSLVPAALPEIPGAELAARYAPGQGSVGGDWYDVFLLPGGELCIVIGDVAGSGLQAAVVMGRMRSALRAYALETDDPALVIAKLDRKIQYFEPGAVATLACAVLDPAVGQARISLAGHLPPILAVPGQLAELVDIPGDPLIGVAADLGRRTTEFSIPSGGMLCLYTDGLVERRNELIDDGIARLLGTLTADPPDTACTRVMHAMIGDGPASDDVALLMLRRL